jgi:hypothetical protein
MDLTNLKIDDKLILDYTHKGHVTPRIFSFRGYVDNKTALLTRPVIRGKLLDYEILLMSDLDLYQSTGVVITIKRLKEK